MAKTERITKYAWKLAKSPTEVIFIYLCALMCRTRRFLHRWSTILCLLAFLHSSCSASRSTSCVAHSDCVDISVFFFICCWRYRDKRDCTTFHRCFDEAERRQKKLNALFQQSLFSPTLSVASLWIGCCMDQFGRVSNAFARSREQTRPFYTYSNELCNQSRNSHHGTFESNRRASIKLPLRALALPTDAVDRPTLANLNRLRKYSIFGCCSGRNPKKLCVGREHCRVIYENLLADGLAW